MQAVNAELMQRSCGLRIQDGLSFLTLESAAHTGKKKKPFHYMKKCQVLTVYFLFQKSNYLQMTF